METRKRQKQRLDGDPFRNARWTTIHDTLQLLLVKDCIHLLEEYDATQVIDMKVYRTKKQIWLQRYYIETNELFWICPLTPDQSDWHLCSLNGTLYNLNADLDDNDMLSPNTPSLLKMDYISLCQENNIQYFSVANYPPLCYNCCTTPSGKIYMLKQHRHETTTKDGFLFEIFMKHNPSSSAAWTRFNYDSEISLSRPHMMNLDERIFAITTDYIIELTIEHGFKKIGNFPYLVSEIDYICKYDETQLLISIVMNFNLRSMNCLLFNINTGSWKEMSKEFTCITKQSPCLLNINHNVYALSELRNEIYKLHQGTGEWQPMETKLSIRDVTSICVHVPKLILN